MKLAVKWQNLVSKGNSTAAAMLCAGCGCGKYQEPETRKRKERDNLKGYNVPEGYMGYVDGIYMLFASEMDYVEFMNGR